MHTDYKLMAARVLSIVGVIAAFAALAVLLTGGDIAVILVALGAGVLGFGGWFVLAPDDMRGIIRGRQVRHGAFAVISSALFIGVLALLYVLATRNEVSADFTQTQRFTLSSASKQALADLKTPIHITGFYAASSIQAQENITVLLRQYSEATGDLITFEFIDLNERPTVAAAYGATADGMLFAQREGDPPELAEFILSSTERQITRAILKLIKSGDFKVYFVAGHGEYDPAGEEDNGMSVIDEALHDLFDIETAELNLLEGEIPEDASGLVIAGAITRFLPAEVDLLAGYLADGGRLMLLADPPLPPDTQQFLDAEDPLVPLLWEQYGVRFREDVVISSANLDSPFEPFGDWMSGDHPVTQNLRQRPPVFSLARSIEAAESRPSGVLVLDLVRSRAEDLGETDFEKLLESPPAYRYDADVDMPGPLLLAAAVQNHIGEANETRIVLVGDSSFVTNEYSSFPGNYILFLDAIDWLIDYSAEIDVEVISDTTRLPPTYTSDQGALIGFLTIIVMPAAVLAVGLVVWWTRQQG
ncbi:MAG: GldG family protein [Anaerolineae bacterium]|nr:GldG family protein [Anaerolineae bacterium]